MLCEKVEILGQVGFRGAICTSKLFLLGFPPSPSVPPHCPRLKTDRPWQGSSGAIDLAPPALEKLAFPLQWALSHFLFLGICFCGASTVLKSYSSFQGAKNQNKTCP